MRRVVWFRVDDGFADHPKVMRCSLAAIGLWTRAGAWCSKHLTDGVVPKVMLPTWGGNSKLAAELVTAGLWDESPESYQFHEWGDRNPTRERIAKRRAEDADRKRKGKPPRGFRAESDADSETIPNGIPPESDPESDRTLARVGRDGKGSGSPLPDPEGTEDRSLFQERAAHYEAWDRAYQVQYARSSGLPCAKTTKYAEHLRALVEWSLAAKLNEAQCRAIVAAFFADQNAEIVEANHWIGWLVPRAAEYLSGPRKPKPTSPGELAAVRSEAVLQAERAEAERLKQEGKLLGMQDMASLAREAITGLRGKVAT